MIQEINCQSGLEGLHCIPLERAGMQLGNPSGPNFVPGYPGCFNPAQAGTPVASLQANQIWP